MNFMFHNKENFQFHYNGADEKKVRHKTSPSEQRTQETPIPKIIDTIT